MPTITKEQVTKLMGISYKRGGNDMVDNINDTLRQCLGADPSMQKLIDVFDGMKHEGGSMEEIDVIIKEITDE